MKLKDKIQIPTYTLGEELINSISHGIGAGLSIAALVLCIVYSAKSHSAIAVVSSVIYGTTSIILYTISCIYHALKRNNGKRVLRIIDHCSIYLLIAGTYTPFALIALPTETGWPIFIVNWICAIIGIVLNAIDLNKYKKFSMALYIIMGWMIVFGFEDLISSVPKPCIILMVIAGLMYTVGAIIYGLGKKKKYFHSIFHFFVLEASILFFFSIFKYVI